MKKASQRRQDFTWALKVQQNTDRVEGNVGSNNPVSKEMDGINLACKKLVRLENGIWERLSLQHQLGTMHLQWICSLLFQLNASFSVHAISFPLFLYLTDQMLPSHDHSGIILLTEQPLDIIIKNLSHSNMVPGIHSPAWHSCQSWARWM